MALGLEPTSVQQQPQPAPADPALVEQIRKETLEAVFGNKYGGDVEKAKQGYWHQNQTIAQQNELLQQLVRPQAAPQAPAQDPFSMIQQEYLIPADVLRSAIQSEARGLVQQELAPLAGVLAARDRIAREVPEFIKNESAIVDFAANNPMLDARVQRLNAAGLPDEAMRIMYDAWRISQPATSVPAPAQYVPATLPGASAPATPERATPSDVLQQNRLMELIQQARATNDEDALWTEFYKDVKFQLPGQ